MSDWNKWKSLSAAVIGATLLITGVQLLLVMPVHLLHIYLLDIGIWPAMTFEKGVLVSLLGTIFVVAGAIINRNVENPFWKPDRDENQ